MAWALRHPRCYRFCYPGGVILGEYSAIRGDEKILGQPLSVFDSVPCRVFGQEEGGRSASARRPASGAGTRADSQPDATAFRGGHRALRGEQTRKRKHGYMPLRAGHYADRFQDRTHGDRLQENAGEEITSGFRRGFFPTCCRKWSGIGSGYPFRLAGTAVTEIVQHQFDAA
jgi:hypothetical protein